jgi:hypothetical protein
MYDDTRDSATKRLNQHQLKQIRAASSGIVLSVNKFPSFCIEVISLLFNATKETLRIDEIQTKTNAKPEKNKKVGNLK